jgi:hypothetical protein
VRAVLSVRACAMSSAGSRAVRKTGTFLPGPIGRNAIEGSAMITMRIGLAAGIFYWPAWYKLAFWILISAIIYGGLIYSGLIIAARFTAAWASSAPTIRRVSCCGAIPPRRLPCSFPSHGDPP